jgi:hypothetical protein
MAPPSQKAAERPISFVLDPGGGFTPIHLPLILRPEDLTHAEPSLQTPTMTFDGAWIDDFGPGIATIQISGHTGWGAGGLPNGIDNFLNLRDTVWSAWHEFRQIAVGQGRNPDTVKLIFADALDQFTSVVAPGQFILKRNKSRPLLMMYQISMTVLSEAITDPASDPLNFNPSQDGLFAGLSSLQASLAKIQAAAANVRSFIQASIVGPIHGFLTMVNGVLSKVMSVVNTIKGVITAQAQQLIGLAADITLVGRNIFYTYNAIASLPDFISQQVAAVAAAFENAFCVLTNAFRKVQQYPDYSSAYGASVCSSTVGGSPLSTLTGVNTFDTVLTQTPPVASVSPLAKANIDMLKATDPVLRPMGLADLGSRTDAVNKGVVVLA